MKKVNPESKVAGMATWFALHRGSVVLIRVKKKNHNFL